MCVFFCYSANCCSCSLGKLIPGSPADRCDELKVDDRIIAVNRVDINGMSHGDIVNLIKESGLHVRLTIGAPKDVTNAVLSSPSNMSSHLHDSHRNNGSINSKTGQYIDNYPVPSTHPQL